MTIYNWLYTIEYIDSQMTIQLTILIVKWLYTIQLTNNWLYTIEYIDSQMSMQLNISIVKWLL